MAEMNFRDYHKAWLSAHPERSEQWLKDHLADGFDVHHIDSDHENNDPENLVLIEHVDHMKFHGLPMRRNKPKVPKPPKERKPPKPSRKKIEAMNEEIEWMRRRLGLV
jgi:hypothetical protein